jgi:cell division protein FtsA
MAISAAGDPRIKQEREIKRVANKIRHAVGLDLGSSATRVVICAVEDDSLHFLGYGEGAVHSWSKGRISDQVALTESVRQAMHEAEVCAGVSPDAVVLGLGGSAAGVNSRGVYEFGRKRQIEASDLRYAVELAVRVQLEDDRLVLQVCPQDFTLDGRAGFRNPVSMSCSRLEANVHIVTASAQEHQALIGAVHQAHLAVEETVFEGVAAAYASIIPEDRARGAALVDIGAHSTHIAIYDGDALLHAAALPVGGDHFTRDISWLLKVNYEDAEHIKREYSAVTGAVSDNCLIELPSPEGRASREAKRAQLNEIVEARAEELLFRVYDEICRVSMESKLLEGVVLTGGGALLTGMCDLAERILNTQVRNGLATGIAGWPEELDSPVWATAAGLAMYSGRLKMRRRPKAA